MTTIAWDGHTLAGDKRTSFGGLHATTTKVHRIAGCLVGAAGTSAQITEMHAWLANGRKPADLPTAQRSATDCCSVLVIEPDGRVLQFENSPYPLAIENKRWAIGSGRDFAMAAMHLGLDARSAVEVAIALDAGSGNGVDFLSLEPAQPEKV